MEQINPRAWSFCWRESWHRFRYGCLLGGGCRLAVYDAEDVSLDISFKYRWAQPSFNYDYVTNFSTPFGAPVPATLHLNPTYNLFSGQVGVAYHF